jgi:hypothetical protein
MTRGKQKIEAQRRNAEKNQKPKGSQIEARAVALKVSCPICKVSSQFVIFFFLCIFKTTSNSLSVSNFSLEVFSFNNLI